MNANPNQNRQVHEDNLYDCIEADKAEYFDTIKLFTTLYMSGIHNNGNEVMIRLNKDEFCRFLHDFKAYMEICHFLYDDEIGKKMFNQLVMYMRLKQ